MSRDPSAKDPNCTYLTCLIYYSWIVRRLFDELFFVPNSERNERRGTRLSLEVCLYDCKLHSEDFRWHLRGADGTSKKKMPFCHASRSFGIRDSSETHNIIIFYLEEYGTSYSVSSHRTDIHTRCRVLLHNTHSTVKLVSLVSRLQCTPPVTDKDTFYVNCTAAARAALQFYHLKLCIVCSWFSARHL